MARLITTEVYKRLDRDCFVLSRDTVAKHYVILAIWAFPQGRTLHVYNINQVNGTSTRIPKMPPRSWAMVCHFSGNGTVGQKCKALGLECTVCWEMVNFLKGRYEAASASHYELDNLAIADNNARQNAGRLML